MKPQVSLAFCPDYAADNVDQAVRKLLDPLGGMGAFVKPGDRVLIKPNLLAPKGPETAVDTHPMVVRAVLREVRAAGGNPFIGDSPGLGNARKNAARSGIGAVAKDLGVPVVEFRESVPARRVREKGFALELSKEALEADGIINLPKLKTHGQMLMTLGVKNMFGCVIGRRKAQWHFKAGVNRDAFARMLVDIYSALSPALTLIDGIVAMEGNGPGSGTPKPLGVLGASADAVALDAVIMDLLGMNPRRLPTLRAARELDVGTVDLREIQVFGREGEVLQTGKLQMADSAGLEWQIPDFLMGIVKDSLSAYPIPDRKLCQLCNTCVEACPQQVIQLSNKGLKIDTRHCIRCFCCQELCPHGAMKTRQGWLLKLLKG